MEYGPSRSQPLERHLHEIKRINFVREHVGEEFPKYKSLTATETTAIREKLAELLAIQPAEGSADLNRSINSHQLPVRGPASDAESLSFDLLEIFGRLGIRPMPKLYINWNSFSDIDQLATADVARYFLDLWYPGPDEINIWDDSYAWIVSVDANGALRYVIFAK